MRIRGTANKQSQFLTENLVFRQFVLAAISNNAKHRNNKKRYIYILNVLHRNSFVNVIANLSERMIYLDLYHPWCEIVSAYIFS